jgi:hypothetical protein
MKRRELLALPAVAAFADEERWKKYKFFLRKAPTEELPNWRAVIVDDTGRTHQLRGMVSWYGDGQQSLRRAVSLEAAYIAMGSIPVAGNESRRRRLVQLRNQIAGHDWEFEPMLESPYQDDLEMGPS